MIEPSELLLFRSLASPQKHEERKAKKERAPPQSLKKTVLPLGLPQRVVRRRAIVAHFRLVIEKKQNLSLKVFAIDQ